MIPLVDLKRQHDTIRIKINSVIKKVIDTSAFVHGEELSKFEREFAKYCGVKYAVGVSSGSDALRLAVLALGIGPGDEVISVANTFIATIDAIVHAGAKPVLVDCDEYFNIDVDKIEAKITKRTKAIIPVHLYGQPARIDKIIKIAKKHKIHVIEDCAQAHGAELKGKKVGSFGDIGCFSFYPAKNLGAMGDGGMAITNNKKLYEKLRELQFHGMYKREYHHELVGFNHLLDNIQAGVLRIKLGHLNEWNNRRRKIAHLYTQFLGNIVVTPKEMKQGKHVYHLYVIKTKRRDQLLDFLRKSGIMVKIHYPIPIHLQTSMKNLQYGEGSFPETEKASNEVLSLPMYPELTEKEVKLVCKTVKDFFER